MSYLKPPCCSPWWGLCPRWRSASSCFVAMFWSDGMSEGVFILAEAVAGALVLVGAFFLFVGSFGLAKLPGLMRRLHAPTKATTLGIGSTLIASMLWFGLVKGDPSFHELMITLFLFLTAP